MTRSVSIDGEADAVGAQIVEQGAVRDRDAVREAGRAARILEIADLVRVLGRKLGVGRLDVAERRPVAAGDAELAGRVAGEIGQLARDRGTACGSLLVSITLSWST